MKIAINMLYLENNTNLGIGKHIEDILIGLERLDVLDEFYLIIQECFFEKYFNSSLRKQPFEKVHFIICSEKEWLRKIATSFNNPKHLIKGIYLNYFVMPGLLKENNIDIVFYPFNASTNNISRKYPAIVVIHDLLYKNSKGPKRGIQRKLYRLFVDMKHKEMLKKPQRIVAISKFVKGDLIKHFPTINKDKIVVIYNAVEVSETDLSKELHNTPYLLCVSEHGIHKNHITLLKSFNLIKNKIPHNLILLGEEREETPKIQEYLKANNLTNRVEFVNNISDGKRNWLYKNTDLLISPSLHEGFGRTPIEAAILGAMVLASRQTSLPEVTCELLNYYEPATDENALATKILELLAEPTSIEARANIAKFFITRYDPAKIANQYYELFIKIYRDIAKV